MTGDLPGSAGVAREHNWVVMLGAFSSHDENSQGAFKVVGDGGQVDLDGSFGETSPPHSVKAVASLPCSENLAFRPRTRWIS